MPDLGNLTRWIDTNIPPFVIYNTDDVNLGALSNWIDTNEPSILLNQQTAVTFTRQFNFFRKRLEFSKTIAGKISFDKLTGEFYIAVING